MTQYNTFNVKLSNLQLNKLGIKTNTEVTFHQMFLVILMTRITFRISCY